MEAKVTREQALTAMADWVDFRGGTPFANVSSPHVVDRANPYFYRASAILSVLSAACTDTQALVGKGKASEFDALNGELLAGALDGIGDLIQLGCFLLGD